VAPTVLPRGGKQSLGEGQNKPLPKQKEGDRGKTSDQLWWGGNSSFKKKKKPLASWPKTVVTKTLPWKREECFEKWGGAATRTGIVHVAVEKRNKIWHIAKGERIWAALLKTIGHGGTDASLSRPGWATLGLKIYGGGAKKKEKENTGMSFDAQLGFALARIWVKRSKQGQEFGGTKQEERGRPQNEPNRKTKSQL